MARKKATEDDVVLDIDEQINQEYGEVLISAKRYFSDPKPKISISPRWDWGTGGGIPQGSMMVLNGPPKIGKAQPLTSLIYTPNGPITMEDIQIGDIVCDPFNKTSTVVGIYPQGIKDVYRIHFQNGDYIDCCDDHICEVWCREGVGKKQNGYKNITLRELRKNFDQTNKWRRWAVRLPACHYETQKVLIDPYIMGLLLGDGSFRKKVGFSSADLCLVNHIDNNLDGNYKIKPQGKSSKYDYIITKGRTGKSNIYASHLKFYGLWNKKSQYKFIPIDYKYNSEEARWAILQGLMDTDGTINSKGTACSYSTTSLRLAYDIKEIVQSLGGICSIKNKRGIYKKKVHYSYRCRISFNDNTRLFRLERKKNLAHPRQKLALRKKITNIEYIGKLECQCISVNQSHGLYVTDFHTVTHNTATALQVLANAREQLDMRVIILPVEGRLKERDAENINNLNIDDVTVLSSTEDNILSAEKQLEILDKILRAQKNVITLIDSFSLLMEEARHVEFGKATRGQLGQILSAFCGRNAQVIPLRNHVIIGVTHTVANTGNGMATKYEKMPSSIAYQLDTKAKWLWQQDKDAAWMQGNDQIGLRPKWKIETHAGNVPINREFTSRFLFGHGISNEAELIDIAIELMIIKKKGSWYSYGGTEDEPLLRGQGWEDLFEQLSQPENKHIYDEIYIKVKEEY